MSHVHVIGKTGVGKSTLITDLVLQDIEAGEGVCFVDPHGDESRKIPDFIPNHRIDDVVYIDASDPEETAALNPFYRVPSEHRATAAHNLTHAAKHLWAHTGWGDRMEYIMFNVFMAVMDCPDHLRPTLRLVLQVMSNQTLREEVLYHVEDDRVREVLGEEFGKWSERFQDEAFAPVQNKLGAFIAHPKIRRMITTWRPNIDLRSTMDEKKILIVRIAKGEIGAKSAGLIGSLVVSEIFTTAMRRAEVPEEHRVPFYMYLDEFQLISTGAFEEIAAEARKYRLSLTASHQHLNQLKKSPGLAEAIFGNVGTWISFRVGNDDAGVLAEQFGEYEPHEFADLGFREVLARVQFDGQQSTAFRGRTRTVDRAPVGRGDFIISQYRGQAKVSNVRRRQRGKRRR